MSKKLLVVLLLLFQSLAGKCGDYKIIYDWKQIQLDLPPEMKAEEFIPANNPIVGIKVHTNRIFLTIPRGRSGVPATLLQLPYDPLYTGDIISDQILSPYPSWEMQQVGNCTAFQYTQSMEIDPFGRMWVIDVGRVKTSEDEPDNKCPPKLVLIDLATDKIIMSYVFPPEVVGRTTNYLNDLVVSCYSEVNCIIYINDAYDAKIVVYDFQKNESWFVQHSTMEIDPTATTINIEGKNYTFNSAVNGIALSQLDTNFTTLFYSPLSSFQIFSVATEKLWRSDESLIEIQLKDDDVTNLGTKLSQSASMVVDAKGQLYFALMGLNAINSWNSSLGQLTQQNQELVAQNWVDLQWPDTFSIDERGDFFVTVNRLHRFSTNSYDFPEINFRIVRINIGAKSYMYSNSRVKCNEHE